MSSAAAPLADAKLAVDDLHVVFGHGAGRVEAVRGVSFAVEQNGSFGIVGESGSGKSTVLRAICGLAPTTAGAIRIDGVPVQAARPRLRPARPDGLPGSLRIAASAPHRGPSSLPSRSPSTASATARSGSSRRFDGRRSRPSVPLSRAAPALRRPAAARRHRPRADPRARNPAPRRADLLARRVGAGGGAQPPDPAARREGLDLRIRQPRPRDHRSYVRAADRHAARSGSRTAGGKRAGERAP